MLYKQLLPKPALWLSLLAHSFTFCALSAQHESLPQIVLCTDAKVKKIKRHVSYTASLLTQENNLEQASTAPSCRHQKAGPSQRIRFKRRGASSDSFDKKQYSVEFIDTHGYTSKGKLLDLPPGKKWVFNAPYVDRSLIRNALAYRVGRALGKERGDPWAAPRIRFCELTLNDEYMGIYAITERIRRQNQRLNIAKIKPESPHRIAFLMEVSALSGPVSTHYGTQLRFRYPSHNKLQEWDMSNPLASKLVQNRVLREVNQLEHSLRAIERKTPPTQSDPEHYSHQIDTTSFIDYFLIQEVFRNVDGFRRSMFFYKEAGAKAKFKMGPLWDFNLAMGNLRFEGLSRYQGWTYRDRFNPVYWVLRNSFWYQSLLKDRDFTAQLVNRYQELRQNNMPLSSEFITKSIEHFVKILGPHAPERDQKRWSKTQNLFERKFMNTRERGKRHLEHIEILRHWLILRLQWLDRHITDLMD